MHRTGAKGNGELRSLFQYAEKVIAQRQLSEKHDCLPESRGRDARAKWPKPASQGGRSKGETTGALPSQLESTMQFLAGLQSQLQSASQRWTPPGNKDSLGVAAQKHYQAVARSMGWRRFCGGAAPKP